MEIVLATNNKNKLKESTYNKLIELYNNIKKY